MTVLCSVVKHAGSSWSTKCGGKHEPIVSIFQSVKNGKKEDLNTLVKTGLIIAHENLYVSDMRNWESKLFIGCGRNLKNFGHFVNEELQREDFLTL